MEGPKTTMAEAWDGESSSMLSLPPQTTPFAMAGEHCQPIIWCPFLSGANFVELSEPVASQRCFRAQTTTTASSTFITFNPDCFPEGYYDLFADQKSEAFYPFQGTAEDERSTLAYPGIACPGGWTTACTTTLTHDGRDYPQAWCCPSGHWTCETTLGLQDMAAPERLCKSVATEATRLWMTFDPPLTMGDDDNEYYTYWCDIPPKETPNAARVYHKVFPLSLTPGVSPRSPAATTLAESSAASSSQSIHGHEESSSLGGGLSGGIIAGIVVGSAVALALFTGSFLILYRRRQNRVENGKAKNVGMIQKEESHVEFGIGQPERHTTGPGRQSGLNKARA